MTEFVEYVFSKIENKDNDKIIIYENHEGYWYPSKKKKPRQLESVIFEKEFVESILEDVKDFWDSEEWHK